MNEKIYILLPVHNRREITRRFMECLALQSHRNFHLVLIDDGSRDGTAEMVRERVDSVTVLTGTGEWWWAGALQQGYRWLKEQRLSGSDVVLIANDDTEFEGDFLESGLRALRGRQRAMVVASCYCRDDGSLVDSGVHIDWSRLSFGRALDPSQVNCLSTRGLFLKASDFLESGGFRPRLLPHYTSDYEFTIRGSRRGIELVCDPSCRLRVDRNATATRDLYVGSIAASLELLFSNRSNRNPLAWTVFVTLSCPWRYKLLNLGRVWMRFLRNLYQIVVLRSPEEIFR